MASIVQSSQRHPTLSSINEKKKLMLNTLEERWIGHGREEMEVAHSMEGLIHLKGQVVTLHPTKKKKMWD